MVGKAFLRPAGRSAIRRERINCRNHNAPDPLGDHGAQGRALEAQADHEDQQWIDHQIDDVDPDRDSKWGPGVLIAAESTVPGSDQQHRGRGNAADPEIGDGRAGYVFPSPHQADKPRREDLDHDCSGEAEDSGEDEGVADPPACLCLVPSAERLRHQGRRGVGEEVEAEEDESEDRGVHAQGRQFVDPYPRHKGSVDEREKWVYRQGPQSRDGEPEDGPIGDPGVGHPAGGLRAKAYRSGNSHRPNSSHCPHNGRLASQTSRPNWMIRIDRPDQSFLG